MHDVDADENADAMSDAGLDRFLKGEDGLSGELRAMRQASPSAALDAAILDRAAAQMADEMASQARPAAANDDADGRPLTPPLQRIGLRWRVPAGIAATLMAGVLAHQAWQASTDGAPVAAVPAPTAAVPSVASPPPPPVAATAENAPPAPMAAKPVPPRAKPVSPQPARRAPPTGPTQSAPSSIPAWAAAPADAQAPASAPAPLTYSAYAARSFAPAAPTVADPTAAGSKATSEPARTVEVSGRRSRFEPAPPPAPAPAPQQAAADPAAWLAAIDKLLETGGTRAPLEEWDRFRAAWPDYPVPAATTDKINALRK
ncbi:MAG: hypothetical protein JWR65_1904 [Massilia sp.]|nr:hypothetical protein [Massilia sp.]